MIQSGSNEKTQPWLAPKKGTTKSKKRSEKEEGAQQRKVKPKNQRERKRREKEDRNWKLPRVRQH